MKKINYYIAALLLISTMVVASPAPIKVVRFSEYTEVNKGETAKVSWEFQNAQIVKITGIETVFKGVDSVSLSPERTEFYTITAYQGKKDSLRLHFIVYVITKKEPEKKDEPEIILESEPSPAVQRGPVQYKYKKLGPSFEKNDFLNGLAKATAKAQPKEMKIMRSINLMDERQFSIRAIALDDYGNHLTGFGDFEDVGWSLTRESGKFTDTKDIEEFFEQAFTDSIHIDIGLALDNSAASSQHNEIMTQIREFLQYLSPDDNIFFSNFNQNYLQMFALSPPEKALWEFDNLRLNKPSGLNALHKAAFKTIKKLGDGFYDDRICILITFNSDNSSIIYTPNDVATITQETEIPIYIIAVGNTVESYTLRFIADASGGKFYHIFDNEIDKLKNILIEIAQSQKAYYEFSVPASDIGKADEMSAVLTMTTKNKEILTKTNLVIEPKLQPVKYQIVSTFDYKESYIKADYEEMLNSLAYILLNNPGYSIQLIGHSGSEGSDKECYDLSLQRAENVKAYLMSQQIQEHLIKVRGDGNHRPLFYSAQTNWQNDYNRRVEIKWLDSELKPYEISLDIFESQAEAEKSLKFWDDNGYKAYFDRFIMNGNPLYEIKIWGYGTLEQAEKAAATISSKYKKKVKVE